MLTITSTKHLSFAGGTNVEEPRNSDVREKEENAELGHFSAKRLLNAK